MLEEFAIKFVGQDEDALGNIGLGITFFGFLVALVFQSTVKSELQRAPYFAYSMLLFLICSALTFLWIFSLQAVLLGVLWMLVSFVFLSIAVIGYFCGVIALARSRDAFGSGRYAILALIPFANFVLFLRTSKNPLSPNRVPTIPLLSGGMGVVSGLMMAAASIALAVGFEVQSDKMVESPNPEQSIAIMIRSQGLDRVLEAMAAESRLPVAIDEVTTLALIEASGNSLTRTYVVTREDFTLSDQFRAGIRKSICAYAPFTVLLHGGAAIEEVYIKTDRSLIGTQVVTQNSCAP